MSAMIQGLVGQLKNGRISNEKELQVNSAACRAFQATGQDQSKAVNLAGRTCPSGKRLYQVLAKGEKAGKSFDENTNKFLTSFKITSKS